MRAAILGQCTGLIPLQVLYAGGLAVVMILSMGGTHVEAMIAQSTVHAGYIASVLVSLRPIPADRVRYMMRCSERGGLGLLAAAAAVLWAPLEWVAPAIVLCLFLYRWCAGAASAFWYPVLQDFVDDAERGRFFSLMRATWSVVTLLAGLGLGWILSTLAPEGVAEGQRRLAYALVLGLMGLCFFSRNLFFRHLPRRSGSALEVPLLGDWRTLKKGLKGERDFWLFLRFLGPQTFFTALFAPLVVTALREHAQCPDGVTVQSSMIGTLGAIAAYVACMGLADRVGPKRMFRACQSATALIAILMAFVLLGGATLDLKVSITALNVGLSATCAALGVATTTYLLHVVHGSARNLCFSLYFALSSLVSGTAVVALGFLMDFGPFLLGVGRAELVGWMFGLSGAGLLLNLPSVRKLREGDWPAAHPPRSLG